MSQHETESEKSFDETEETDIDEFEELSAPVFEKTMSAKKLAKEELKLQ